MLLQNKNIVLGSFRGINNIQNPPLNLQKLIISDIRKRKILAFLRTKNKLDDFVDTLERYLPISRQSSNLQFVSRWDGLCREKT